MRLNKDLREDIVRNAMKVKFDKRRAVLDAREAALIDDLYEILIPKTQRDLVAALLIHNPSWVASFTSFDVKCDGYTVVLRRIAPHVWPSVRSGYTNHVYVAQHVYSEKHPTLAKAIMAHANELETFKEERKTAERTLEALLKSVRTTETLAKLWPEGAKLYSAPPLVAPPAKANLPVAQLRAMNELLGLTEQAA